MKQFILYTIFCNVLSFPWGLSVKGLAPALPPRDEPRRIWSTFSSRWSGQ